HFLAIDKSLYHTLYVSRLWYRCGAPILWYDYLFGIVTTATEWHFLLYTPDGISCTSRNPLNIRFVKTALEEGSEDEKELCKNVKRVMEVIVGLLRERVDVEKEPKNKKARVQEYLKKE